MEHASTELEKVELSMKQAKAKIQMRDALNRLTKNTDFTEVIVEGYFKTYASNLVLMKAEPSQEDPADQRRLDNAIIAVGELQQFFRSVLVQGDMADKALVDNEEALEELRQ